MTASRQLARRSLTPEALRDAFMASYDNKESGDYLCLQVVPNYFEDLAILLKQGAIDGAFAEPSLGAVLRDAWRWWEAAAEAWRGEDKPEEEKEEDPWPFFRDAARAPDLFRYARRRGPKI